MESSSGPWLGAGTFPKHWIDGTNPEEPPLQVHRYAEHTWILRQSVLTDFEGPFLYLFVGQERGLLVDTGAGGGVPLRGTIDHLIGTGFPLVVAHSHAHRDHVADDAQFIDRPDTTIVAHGPEDVARFFGIIDWPVGTGRLDLGGRHLDVIPIPGHEPASIALYDHRTRLLLTGDTVYPGRLYVRDFSAFRASIDRLVDFTAAHEVTWVLGAHIEMTSEKGVDYEYYAATHPNERELQLGRQHLVELKDLLHAMGDEVRYEVHDDFIVVPR